MARGVLFDVDDALVDHTGASRAAIVHRLDHDALGARDAGLIAVWPDRHGSGPDAPDGVVRIRSLAELEEMLA